VTNMRKMFVHTPLEGHEPLWFDDRGPDPEAED